MPTWKGTTALELWITLAAVTLVQIPGRIIEEDIVIPDERGVAARTNPGASDTWITRVVPVELNKTTNSDDNLWKNVGAAIAILSDVIDNCLKFVRKKEEHVDYISVTGYKNQGCYSAIGKRGGKQLINIDPNCMSVGIIMHEFLHALGFWHEQSRSDRDVYVQVLLRNVKTDKIGQFTKRYDNTRMEKAVPYDLRSILHYKHDQFARWSGLDTIIPRGNFDKTLLGQRKELSYLDIRRLSWLYKCGRYRVNGCPKPDLKVEVSPRLTGNYNVGATIDYSCKDDKEFLFGPPSSVCKANGQWSGAIPYCFKKSQFLYPLDFENSFSDNRGRIWTPVQDPKHTTRFQINAGQTPTQDSGPHTDHTHQLSTGSYLYLEGSGVPVGAAALLDSPIIRLVRGSEFCILFFYNMYGNGTGALTVSYCSYFIRPCKQSITLDKPAADNEWYMHMWKPVVRFDMYAVIKFEATRGGNDRSDIAIDDLLIGPCSQVEAYYDLTKRTAAYDFKQEHDEFVYDGSDLKT